MERQTVTQNQQTGSGLQNNNTAKGTQNISFINSFNSAAAHPHKTLWDSVAGIGASHNAEQQYERGVCLKGTRRRALKMIYDWRRGKGGDEPICWLSGAAGVGKSAIAMTVAKSCEEKGALVSSFFFFRSDHKRNNHSALVLAIAHGLVTTIPSCRDFINRRIADDPKILEAQLEIQFRELVLRPFVYQALGPDVDQDPSAAVARKTSSDPLVLEGPSYRQYRRWWQLVWTFLFFWLFVQQDGDPPQEDDRNRRGHFTGGVVDASQGVLRQDIPTREDHPDKKHNAACTKGPTLVIIDGLDECGGEAAQRRILSTILSAFQHPQFSMKFLICSRPEAWIREAFSTKPLSLLSNVIVLDESFVPDQDIRKYYCHRFHEISNRYKYNHIQFPIPWPSEDELEDLVDRSCGQFVHAATTVKFIDSEFKHPITQLRSLLQQTASRRPRTLPYQQLDALYDYILGVNPEYEEVCLILTSILVLPPKARTPACIELLLGLPAGQVAMSIRGMHSVLDIQGPGDEINLFHTSFRDYLTDQVRSRQFYIDLEGQKYAVARQWLKNLTTSKVQTYSSEELYGENSMVFFTEWIGFCVSIPEPTRDLLEHLSEVDLTFTYLIEMIRCHLRTYATWNNRFAYLVPWVRTYLDSHICEDEPEAGVGLMHRLQNRPSEGFHLQCPVDVRNDILHWVIDRATKCPGSTRLDGSPPRDVDNLCLTDCHCSLSGGNESQDVGHLAYQEACLQLVKAFVSLFEMLAHSGLKDDETIRELGNVFLNVVHLLRLQHCRLDTELLLLCRTFFGLAKGCSVMRIVLVDETSGLKDSMLSWIETFPGRFAKEGESLKAQILDLPWEKWEVEHNTSVYNVPELWSIRYRA